MKLKFLFAVFSISLILSCSDQDEINTYGFEPWGYTSNAEILSEEFSSEYMNSRAPRISEKLNEDWTFFYSPDPLEKQEFTSSDYKDNEWQLIRIPHTWMTYETTGDLHPFIMNASENEDAYWWRGWGYYRKKIEIDPSLKEKRFFLEFDGVQKYCIIYINGQRVGEHKGGFNSFSVDISPYIDWSKAQQSISVSVNGYRRDKWKIPPMTAGNWDVYSGIYRPVRLLVKNDIYIPYQGNFDHEGGTFVTTPFVKNNSAIIQVATYIKNDRTTNQEVLLLTQITDAKDSVLAEIKETRILLPEEISKFEQKSSILKNIKYWSDTTPVLYKVKSMVYAGNELVDSYESPLGIRTFYWNYTTNDLHVNGEKINIKGTNRHQEYPWLGDALPEWITLNDMMDIKYGQGINFMRTAHYPQIPVVYDFNNQHGIITVEEVPNIKNIDFNDEVQEQNVRAMIRRDRNNPSIFFWSVGNETSDAANSEWIIEEDTTRIIHARKAEGGGEYVQHTHLNLDMENLLRVTHRGWFTNQDVTESINPNPSNGQEAGSNSWQYEKAKIMNGSIRGNLNHNCIAWLYQDHGADRNYKNSLLTALNAKGWVDMYRIPKYVYFLTKANYTNEPFIYLQSAYWRRKFIGQRKSISVDSNCEEVELFINNKSIGKQKVSKINFNSVSFNNIEIVDGTVEVIGYIKGKPVVDQVVKMAKSPKRIVLKSTSSSLDEVNEKTAVITAYIVDEDGTIVYDIAPDLEWIVEGEASLVGPSLYKNDLNKKEARSGTGYEAIPVCNVVRGTTQGGKVKITVKSQGITEGSITLKNHTSTHTSGIKQPKLSAKGRKKVIRDLNYKETYSFSEIVKTRLYTNTTFQYSDEKKLRSELASFLKQNEGTQNLYGAGYNTLLDQLVSIVKRMNGILIGDDFNFLMQQYNMYLNIEQVIDSRMFHVDYSELLKNTYLKSIMINHEQIDFSTECDLINSYPQKTKVCHVVFEDKNTLGTFNYDYVTRTYTIITSKSNIYDFVSKSFKFSNNSQRMWSEICRITPHISFDTEAKRIKFEGNNRILIIPDAENEKS